MNVSGYCKHLNGSFHNKTCEAGVCYRDVTPDPDRPGSHYREPCRRFGPENEHALKVIAETGPQGICDKYEEPTAEEIAADEKAIEEMIARHELVHPLIEKVKQEHRGKGWQGVEVCPVCQGRLRMSHAAINGHVWGKCETEGCLSWME